MVKLSQNSTNISRVAKEVKRAGGSGVSAINAIRCILGVDIKTATPLLPTYGGYSGPPIKPLGLASVASLAQAVDLPICGIGGIESYENALEYIMLGASAVQVGTALMLNGRPHITQIVEDLDRWGDENGMQDAREIRGRALENLKSFEEIKVEPITCKTLSIGCAAGCDNCSKVCIYGAVRRSMQGDIVIDSEFCTGCGLCTFVCPVDKLYLNW
jgi:ferredoxin